MVEGSAKGRLGLAGDLEQAPLDVQLDLRVADPSLRGLLAPLGVGSTARDARASASGGPSGARPALAIAFIRVC